MVRKKYTLMDGRLEKRTTHLLLATNQPMNLKPAHPPAHQTTSQGNTRPPTSDTSSRPNDETTAANSKFVNQPTNLLELIDRPTSQSTY